MNYELNIWNVNISRNFAPSAAKVRIRTSQHYTLEKINNAFCLEHLVRMAYSIHVRKKNASQRKWLGSAFVQIFCTPGLCCIVKLICYRTNKTFRERKG